MTKFFILPAVLMMLSFHSFGQQSVEQQLFAMIYTTGAKWDMDKQPHEQAYFKAHSKHMKDLRQSGKIVIGGRYEDKGFMLLRAKNLEEANAIVESDSSVMYGTFQVELFRFNPFYYGCIEKEEYVQDEK